MSLNDKLLPHAEELFSFILGANWRPKGPGPEYSCRCPFHNDKSPSFSANPAKGLWKCHVGCGGGDLVDLAAKYWKLDPRTDFVRLVQQLESVTRADLSEKPKAKPGRSAKAHPQQNREAGDAERDRKWCPASEWPAIVAAAAKTPPPADFLAKRAISPEVAAAAKLGIVTRKTTPRDWWVPEGSEWTLIIPVSAGEKVIGFELRPEKGFPAREAGEKPLKSVSTGKNFYRAPTPKGDYGRWVFLCEGPLDALAAASAGVRACSALPGANTWDAEWGHLLWDRWVCVAYDDDAAGVANGAKVAHALFPYACAVRVVNWHSLRQEYPGREFKKDVGDLMTALPQELRRSSLDRLAESALFNPRDLLPHLPDDQRGRLVEALTGLGGWPLDHGVRVIRNAYYVEEKEKGLVGPLTDFTFRVKERRHMEDAGLNRLIRVRGPCDVPGSEKWAGDGEWRSVAAAREKVYGWGAFFLKEQCNPVQWGRILAREEKRIAMPTVRGLLHLGRLDAGEGERIRFAPATGPWIFGDSLIEGGKIVPVEGQRASSPSAGSLYLELDDARIQAQSGAASIEPAEIFRNAIEPWNQGEEREHRWALGWAAAAAFMPEWASIFDGFPLLFLCGEAESGKTQFGTLIMRLWGIRGKPSSFSNSTVKSLIFDAGSLSCLPMVRDEYRETGDGDKELGKKLSWLRGIFDRADTRRGTVKDKSVSRPVRAALCVMGQHWPERDEAVNSRSIIVEFAKKQWNRDTRQLRWLTSALRTGDVDLAVVGRRLALEADSMWPKMREAALKLREQLGEWTAGAVGERTLDGAAICGAGWCAVTGEATSFVLHDLIRFCLKRGEERQATNPVSKFLEWIGAKIIERGPYFDPFNDRCFCIWREDYDLEGQRLILRLHVEKAFELYREHMAKQRMPCPEEQELRRLFRNMPCCIGYRERFRLHLGKNGRGWLVDLEKGPEPVKEAVEMAIKANSSGQRSAVGGDEGEEEGGPDGPLEKNARSYGTMEQMQ